jgi:heme exporter protein D
MMNSASYLGMFGFFGFLISIAVPIFFIYVAITIMKLMKQKNEYLKDIRNELKKNNSFR